MPQVLKTIILLGRKKGFYQALKFTLSKKIKIAYIVTDEQMYPKIHALTKKYHISVSTSDEILYKRIADKSLSRPDLVISYLFWKKIKMPLISFGRKGCINFHPAPLPDYKGRAGYNTAILDKRNQYGVSAHIIDSEKLDAGPIIRVDRFPIDPEQENAHSLEQKSQKHLLSLFKDVLSLYIAGTSIHTTSNTKGIFLDKKGLEALKAVSLDKESPDAIHRKIRAFFFPPYRGATIEIKGVIYTLIDDEILAYIHTFL